MPDKTKQNSIGGEDLQDILYGKLCKEVFIDDVSEFSEEKVVKIQNLIQKLELLSPNKETHNINTALAKFREETSNIDRGKRHKEFVGKLRKFRNIAATIIIIFGFLYATNTIVADATGFNFLEVAVDFSKSISFSKGPTPIASDDLIISKNTFTDISSAVVEFGVETPLPNYLPIDITIKQVDVIKKHGATYMEVICINENEDVSIRLSYSYYFAEKAIATHKFTELYTQVDSYNVLGNTVYVYSDVENQMVYWNYENFIVSMQTKLNLNEIRRIMNSMEMNGG